MHLGQLPTTTLHPPPRSLHSIIVMHMYLYMYMCVYNIIVCIRYNTATVQGNISLIQRLGSVLPEGRDSVSMEMEFLNFQPF